jgi:hypothetical protein
MKKFKEMIIFLSLLFAQLSTFSHAGDMSQCNSISDYDQRQMCRAQAGRMVSECGFIQNNDLRYLCTAQVGNRKSDCGFIQNANLRSTCQATAK